MTPPPTLVCSPNTDRCFITAAVVLLFACPSRRALMDLISADYTPRFEHSRSQTGDVSSNTHAALHTFQDAGEDAAFFTHLARILCYVLSSTVPTVTCDAQDLVLADEIEALHRAMVPHAEDEVWNSLRQAAGVLRTGADVNEFLELLVQCFGTFWSAEQRMQVGAPIARLGHESRLYPQWNCDGDETRVVVVQSERPFHAPVLRVQLEHDMTLTALLNTALCVVERHFSPVTLVREEQYTALASLLAAAPDSALAPTVQLTRSPQNGGRPVLSGSGLLARRTSRLAPNVFCAVTRPNGAAQLRLSGRVVVVEDRRFAVRALVLHTHHPCFLHGGDATGGGAPNHFCTLFVDYDNRWWLADDTAPALLDVTAFMDHVLVGRRGEQHDERIEALVVRFAHEVCTVALEEL